MNVYEKMERLLREDPRARERVNKDRAIRVLLTKRFPDLQKVPKFTLIKALRAYSSYDRAWRKATEEFPELRGSDWAEKFHLEEAKKKELGYPTKPYKDE